MKKTIKPLPRMVDIRIVHEANSVTLVTWTTNQRRYFALILVGDGFINHYFTGDAAETIEFCKECPTEAEFIPFIKEVA